MCLSSHSREQAPQSGVLELELEDVEQLDKPKRGIATMRAEYGHGYAVSSAYWDPRGRSIMSTCYDDVLRSTYCRMITRVLPVLTRGVL
jgi:hypothetical protein